MTVPLNYGAMPNLGLYSQPDGPSPNWSELLPLGRIDEARAAQEEASSTPSRTWSRSADAHVGGRRRRHGLRHLRRGRRRRLPGHAPRGRDASAREYPDMGIELGMAGEFVLGMHGQLEYDGVRLAGLWPREQMKLAARPERPSSGRPST